MVFMRIEFFRQPNLGCAIFDKASRQAATDGGYASRDNLAEANALGVRDMAFHKKRGLSIEDMVESRWVYRRLRNFRAGI